MAPRCGGVMPRWITHQFGLGNGAAVLLQHFWWPNKSAPWSAATQLCGQKIPQPQAGLPKWQTKQPPRLLASSFGHWPCVNAQRTLPSPLWPTVPAHATSWYALHRAHLVASTMAPVAAPPCDPMLNFSPLSTLHFLFPLSPRCHCGSLCPPEVRHEFTCDLDSSWTKVSHAMVDGHAQATSWRSWSTWCARNAFDKFLIGIPPAQHVHALVSFAARVRSGTFGNGKQIAGPSVATALRHVAQVFVLAQHHDPRRAIYSHELGLAFTRLCHPCCHEDPAPKPQLALPA
jgi:hypothetical protein